MRREDRGRVEIVKRGARYLELLSRIRIPFALLWNDSWDGFFRMRSFGAKNLLRLLHFMV